MNSTRTAFDDFMDEYRDKQIVICDSSGLPYDLIKIRNEHAPQVSESLAAGVCVALLVLSVVALLLGMFYPVPGK